MTASGTRAGRFGARVMAIAWKEVLHIQRDPRTIILALVMPVVMLLLFGYGVSFDIDHVRLAVSDLDRTEASRRAGAGLHRERRVRAGGRRRRRPGRHPLPASGGARHPGHPAGLREGPGPGRAGPRPAPPRRRRPGDREPGARQGRRHRALGGPPGGGRRRHLGCPSTSGEGLDPLQPGGPVGRLHRPGPGRLPHGHHRGPAHRPHRGRGVGARLDGAALRLPGDPPRDRPRKAAPLPGDRPHPAAPHPGRGDQRLRRPHPGEPASSSSSPVSSSWPGCSGRASSSRWWPATSWWPPRPARSRPCCRRCSSPGCSSPSTTCRFPCAPSPGSSRRATWWTRSARSCSRATAS